MLFGRAMPASSAVDAALDCGADTFDLRAHGANRFAVIVDADSFAAPRVTVSSEMHDDDFTRRVRTA